LRNLVAQVFLSSGDLLRGRKDMLKTAAVLIFLGLAAATPAQAQTASSHPAARAAAPAPTSLASNQFSSEQTAKAHCPGDTIVWANLGSSRAYHLSGDRYYGKTKHGAYMCQKEADQAGFHAAGRRPSKAAAKGATAKTTR
jgi:hypothetical protein